MLYIESFLEWFIKQYIFLKKKAFYTKKVQSKFDLKRVKKDIDFKWSFHNKSN